jgi:hypothetical protein
MKVIIDLIEDIREEIGNQEDFVLTAILLKESPEDAERLVSAGEAILNHYDIDDKHHQLILKIDRSDTEVTVGKLIRDLLILPMSDMMFELKIDVNTQYSSIEVVGFGKSIEEKKYILFIKL